MEKVKKEKDEIKRKKQIERGRQKINKEKKEEKRFFQT